MTYLRAFVFAALACVSTASAGEPDGLWRAKGRFGPDALCFVNAQPTRDQNLRGIYWKVIESGEATVGAPIQVLARGEVKRET